MMAPHLAPGFGLAGRNGLSSDSVTPHAVWRSEEMALTVGSQIARLFKSISTKP
jgi:hypothetical protein